MNCDEFHVTIVPQRIAGFRPDGNMSFRHPPKP
jgi:hypothetical protein